LIQWSRFTSVASLPVYHRFEVFFEENWKRHKADLTVYRQMALASPTAERRYQLSQPLRRYRICSAGHTARRARVIQYRFNRWSTEYCYYSRTRYASGTLRFFLFTFLIFPCSTRRFPLVHSVVVYWCSCTVCLRHYHLRACRKYFFLVASPGHAPRLVVFSTLIDAAPYCSVSHWSWFIFFHRTNNDLICVPRLPVHLLNYRGHSGRRLLPRSQRLDRHRRYVSAPPADVTHPRSSKRRIRISIVSSPRRGRLATDR